MASKYPVAQLHVGQSFTFPSKFAGSVNNAVYIHRRSFPEKRFSVRRAEDRPGYHRCKRIDPDDRHGVQFEMDSDGPVEM